MKAILAAALLFPSAALAGECVSYVDVGPRASVMGNHYRSALFVCLRSDSIFAFNISDRGIHVMVPAGTARVRIDSNTHNGPPCEPTAKQIAWCKAEPKS